MKPVMSRLEIPRKFSTLALTSSVKPPETNHRRGRSKGLEEGGRAGFALAALVRPPGLALGKVAQEGRWPGQPTCTNPKETLLLPMKHVHTCLFY